MSSRVAPCSRAGEAKIRTAGLQTRRKHTDILNLVVILLYLSTLGTYHKGSFLNAESEGREFYQKLVSRVIYFRKGDECGKRRVGVVLVGDVGEVEGEVCLKTLHELASRPVVCVYARMDNCL